MSGGRLNDELVMQARAADLLRICQQAGIEARMAGRAQAVIACPAHEERTPSCHLYLDGDPHWHCFGCGAHGDAIDLVMRLHGVDFRRAVEMLAGPASLPPAAPRPARPPPESTWTPQAAAPPGAAMPQPAVLRHIEHGEPAAIYPYEDQLGALLCVRARYLTPAGKVVLPWSWATSDRGPARWICRAPPKPWPLYRLPRLAECAEVLLVEGEKSADAAHALVGQRYACLSWYGGCQGVAHCDWSPLRGLPVVTWPDNDPAGLIAARRISWHLGQLGVTLRAADLCAAGICYEPRGWDLADA